MRLCLKEWDALNEICERENIARNHLIELIEDNKDAELGLTYSTRLFIVIYYRTACKLAGRKNSVVKDNKYKNIMTIIHEISE